METTVLDPELIETQSEPILSKPLNKPRYSKSRKGIGGRPGVYTLEVVTRIAERIGYGMPVKFATAGEKNPQINESSWENMLQTKPQFKSVVDFESCKFMERCLPSLIAEKDWKAKAWLLERRYLSFFAPPASQVVTINNDNRQVKLGITQEQLDTLSRLALEDAKQLKRAKQLK